MKHFANGTELTIRLPENVAGLSQIEEYFLLGQEGQERAIRLHDYDEIYRIPGLYERLIVDMLKCESQDVIPSLLIDSLSRGQVATADMAVLELGAGTGLVGSVLSRMGAGTVVGIDIIPEAKEAAYRDHPGVYAAYYVEDLCNLSAQSRRELEAYAFNCLVCVSALGLNHIPPAVFAEGFNLIRPNGRVAFNVNENYLEDRNAGGFPSLVNRLVEEGQLEIQIRHSYRHRFAVDGSPITYVALIGRKRADIPANLV